MCTRDRKSPYPGRVPPVRLRALVATVSLLGLTVLGISLPGTASAEGTPAAASTPTPTGTPCSWLL
ncbi:MAG: hypothetical protein JWN87_422, partial [Frankiales bacterium]|nr:hypothetical protein [Frankiales bacterium]